MNNPFIKGHSHFTLVDSQAERPVKKHPDHPSLELVLIERTENRYEDVALDINEYRTGLNIEPPEGYHYEIVADPKLYRHGYFLVNSPIVLDPEMKGEIVVPLYKFKENDDLPLPFTACHLILRKNIRHHVSLRNNKQQGQFFPPNISGPQIGLLNENSKGVYTPDFMGSQQMRQMPQSMNQPQPSSRTNHMF